MAAINRIVPTIFLAAVFLLNLVLVFLSKHPGIQPYFNFNATFSLTADDVPTSLNHLAFGLQGSEKTYHWRRHYVESWWRKGKTRGYVYLDREPEGDLLPWPEKSPAYKLNENLTERLLKINPKNNLMPRMVHGIVELFRDEHEGLRWLIMGDDDTVFFQDNLVHELAKLDHRKYYYIGYPSEHVRSNYQFGFFNAFGGGGIILSAPLVKALVNDMDRCLRVYANYSADEMTANCIADLGVDLTPHRGVHQMDLKDDVSGFLSGHPKDLVLSFHHIDKAKPYFPSMNRSQSLRHLMKAAEVDQLRLFQQTICYNRKRNWSFLISWGYSVHIYEHTLTRSWLKNPLETFSRWNLHPHKPFFMFDTRPIINLPCFDPHVFHFESIKRKPDDEIVADYTRSANRNLTTCPVPGSQSADYVTRIIVISPSTKPYQIGKSECCDVVHVDDEGKVGLKIRECRTYEVIGR